MKDVRIFHSGPLMFQITDDGEGERGRGEEKGTGRSHASRK